MLRSICAASCLLAVGALLSCVSPRPLRETSPVRIGILADLSSTGAREGNDALRGAELRIDRVNAAGGIGGRQIELVVRDVKQSAAEAVKAFTQLAQEERVCAVIGSVAANSGLSVSPVSDLARVPLVSLGVDDRVTNPEMKPENPELIGSVRQFAFLLPPSATQAAASFAGYVIERFTWKRYATLYDPASPVSVLQARAFEKVVKKSGRTVAASVAMPEGDLATPLRELRDAGIDAVFVCASTEKNVTAAKGIRESLPQVALLGNQAWYAPVAAPAGDASSPPAIQGNPPSAMRATMPGSGCPFLPTIHSLPALPRRFSPGSGNTRGPPWSPAGTRWGSSSRRSPKQAYPPRQRCAMLSSN